MARQLYELQIEEILRECEEAALREETAPRWQIGRGTHSPALMNDWSYRAAVCAVSTTVLLGAEARPVRKLRPSRVQLALLGCIILAVSLMLSYFGIVDHTVALVTLLALVTIAIGDTLFQEGLT